MVVTNYPCSRPYYRLSQEKYRFHPLLASEKIPVVEGVSSEQSLTDFRAAFESNAPSLNKKDLFDSEFFYQLKDGTWLAPEMFEGEYVTGRFLGVGYYTQHQTVFSTDYIADTVYFRNFVMVGGISIRRRCGVDKKLTEFFDLHSRVIGKEEWIDTEFLEFVHCIGDFDQTELERRYQPKFMSLVTTQGVDAKWIGNPVDMALQCKNEDALRFFFNKGHVLGRRTPIDMHVISDAMSFASDELLKAMLTAENEDPELWKDVLHRAAVTPRFAFTKWILDEHQGLEILADFNSDELVELVENLPVNMHRLFHEYGFDTHKVSFGDVCPIYAAIVRFDFSSARWFLDRGFDPNFQGKGARGSSYETVEEMLEKRREVPWIVENARAFLRECDSRR